MKVWKEDHGAQEFDVFVYLERKISDFKDELEDEFVLRGGGLMRDIIYYLIIVLYYFWYFYVKKRYFRFR